VRWFDGRAGVGGFAADGMGSSGCEGVPFGKSKKNHGRTIDKTYIFVYLWIYKRAAMLPPQKNEGK
jgi:hypothetical protein